MLFSVEISPKCKPEEISLHARTIEEAGFYRIWVRDMITVPWEMWSAITTIINSTKKIRVGLDVTNVYTRHPAVTAHAASTLDRISGGRIDLGFGKGIASQLQMMNIKISDNAMAEGIEIVSRLLKGEKLYFNGEYFKTNGLSLPVLPLNKNMPIFIAAMESGSIKRAGKLANGILTISSSIEFLIKIKEWAKDERGYNLPVSTWIPFAKTEEERNEIISRIGQRLPEEFLKISGIGTIKENRKVCEKVLIISDIDNLKEKIVSLKEIGISELIIEYSHLQDLIEIKSKMDFF